MVGTYENIKTEHPLTIAGSGLCRNFEITTKQNTTMTNLLSPLEIFKPIIGYEGYYEASNFGRIKSIERIAFNGMSNHILKSRILKHGIKENGYLHVCLCKNGKAKHYHVHRLVASAFIPNPEGKPQVNHINGKPSDNRVANLEWVTMKENHRHAYDVLGRPGANTGRFGALNGKSKEVQMISIDGDVIRTFESVMEASRELRVCEASIRSVIYGKSKLCAKHKWRYVDIRETRARW